MEGYLKYLGLARKAGKVLIGQKTILNHLKHKGRLNLILLAADISDNTKKKLKAISAESDTACFEAGTTDEISGAIGVNGVGVVGVYEPNLAGAIIAEFSKKQSGLDQKPV